MTIAVDLGRKATKQTNKKIASIRLFGPITALLLHLQVCDLNELLKFNYIGKIIRC